MAINNETIIVTKDLSIQIFTSIQLSLSTLKIPNPAYLATRTNKGHTDLFYENYNDNPNRSSVGEHSSGRMMGEGYLTARTLSSMDALPNTTYDLEGNRPRLDQTEVTHKAYLLRPDFDLFACTQLISGHLLLLVFVCDHSLLRWTRRYHNTSESPFPILLWRFALHWPAVYTYYQKSW